MLGCRPLREVNGIRNVGPRIGDGCQICTLLYQYCPSAAWMKQEC